MKDKGGEKLQKKLKRIAAQDKPGKETKKKKAKGVLTGLK